MLPREYQYSPRLTIEKLTNLSQTIDFNSLDLSDKTLLFISIMECPIKDFHTDYVHKLAEELDVDPEDAFHILQYENKIDMLRMILNREEEYDEDEYIAEEIDEFKAKIGIIKQHYYIEPYHFTKPYENNGKIQII